ncbi:MAG TPA: RNA polymerase subunit sigma-70 [Solirubrobacteraceae bacterium]|nr:RNA polymerase subunit sigma-70 [Solirubrobacteraceae bacterium]
MTGQTSRTEDRQMSTATQGRIDEGEFTALAERHRRELHVHCYRMLGSFEESEDMVQETFLRAWRKRASFQGRSTFRAWLYRIATNACLDALGRRPREAPRPGAFEVTWLQPYPDRLLDELASSEAEPDAAVVEKETVELAFLVALQRLAPRPRAVLILRDVLGWSAKETAALLEVSVASANSALQRARAALKDHLPERRLEWAAGAEPSAQERALLDRYVEASERGDAEALAGLMREDLRFAMPPEPEQYVGRDTIVAAWVEGGFGSDAFGAMRCMTTRANRQPAVACWLRRPGDSAYRALALDVLRIEDGAVAEITTFPASLFPAFDLPPTR